jgi:hypothetical protein
LGRTSIVTFTNPLARAISRSIVITLATYFESDKAKISILSFKSTLLSPNLISSSVNDGKSEETFLRRFSNLISSTISVLPYLSHISGIAIINNS